MLHKNAKQTKALPLVVLPLIISPAHVWMLLYKEGSDNSLSSAASSSCLDCRLNEIS